MTAIVPLGDRAFLARLATEDEAARWAVAVRDRNLPGVLDVVPAYDTVGVHADPDQVDLDDLADRLGRLEPAGEADRQGRLIRIPVLYDGDDLAEVAERLGLTEQGVIAAHTARDYQVFGIGFQPGYPYAGYLPSELCGLARRASPRTRVPAGSVAIVGRQTAVYSTEAPGGWHLIGRTPLRIVDVPRGRFPIRAGDRLRFVPIGPDEFEAGREDLR
jgi:KipI family sensor histidine kinase inhibitor